jgi:hypothetical protein
LAEIADAASGVLLEFARLVEKSPFKQLAANIERLLRLVASRFADGVVQLFGKQRFSRLGLFDGAPHVFEQLLEVLFLLAQTLDDILAVAGIA